MNIKTLIAVAALTTTAGAALAGGHVVRLGTEGAFPPYNFINDAGEVDGFEREVGDALCALAQLECTWVVNGWDTIIPNLVSGNYDAIIAGMSITTERDEVIDFTEGYFPSDPSKYVGPSGMEIDVNSAIIAAQTNTIHSSHVASSGATLVEFSTPDESISAMRNGEVDAVLAGGEYLDPIVAESNGELAVLGQIVLGGEIGVGVRESDGELKAKFNAAIKSMKADGSLNALIAKWFDGKQGY